jgi:hypothetical protein
MGNDLARDDQGLAGWADNLSRLAAVYRDRSVEHSLVRLRGGVAIDGGLKDDRLKDDRDRAIAFGLGLAVALVGRDPAGGRALHDAASRAYICARAFDSALDVEDHLDLELDGARELADCLDAAGTEIRRIGHQDATGEADPGLEGRAEARVLDCLARLLPAHERATFVYEVRGNIGVCGGRCQRLCELIGVVMGTPRLAVMMRLEGRRRRA